MEENVGELLDLDDMIVFILLDMIVLPYTLVWDMHTPTSKADDGVDVGLEGVAD